MYLLNIRKVHECSGINPEADRNLNEKKTTFACHLGSVFGDVENVCNT